MDVENSVTVVPEMIKVFRQLLEKKATGIFHVTNPGSIKHREILEMYEEIVDPKHTNDWISEADLVKDGLAKKKRSNNVMQSENLEKLGIKMTPIKEALRAALKITRKLKINNYMADILDNLRVISKLDSQNMLGSIERLGRQAQEVWTQGAKFFFCL